MRPDLTVICARCRVRLPKPAEHATCPFCMKILQLGKQTRLARTSRPWPVWPWKILGWLAGLLGLAAVVAVPVVTVLAMLAAFVESDETSLMLAVSLMPVGIMALALGIGIGFGLFGAAFALVLVIFSAILRPARGFDVYPLDGAAPVISRSRLLELLLRIEWRTKPALDEKRRQNITGVLTLAFALIALPIALFSSGIGWGALCISGFAAMLWGVGWSWWLVVVAEGPSWFVGLMDPTYAKKRRAACPTPNESMRRDDFVAGTIVGPLEDLIPVPDGGDHAIAWHVRGHAKKHVIDDAQMASFLMVTDDDERIAVLASPNVLIELSPKDAGTVDGAFLFERGFGSLTPDRLALRRLRKGDRVEVSGKAAEIRDPEAGYRGGMLRALEASDEPLVVRHAE